MLYVYRTFKLDNIYSFNIDFTHLKGICSLFLTLSRFICLIPPFLGLLRFWSQYQVPNMIMQLRSLSQAT